MASFGPPDSESSFSAKVKRLIEYMNDRRLFAGISAERLALIRKRIASEVEDELREMLTPKIRKQLEREFKNQALKEARSIVQEEIQSARPSPEDLQAFKNYAREVEIDAEAQALIASRDADSASEQVPKIKRGQLINGLAIFWFMLAILYAVLAYGLSLAIAGLAFGWVTTFVMAIVYANRRQDFEGLVKSRRKTSSDYLLLAEEARIARTVKCETLLDNITELNGLLSKLQQKKNDLDNDFHPSVDAVNDARAQVRLRIQTEDLDFEKEIFDQQLAEAEARQKA